MSRYSFSEIFVHIVWHTKHSLPSITPELEPHLYERVRQKCQATDGVFSHGVGGTETHVHLVISIEPTILLCDFIGQVKGASAFETNKVTATHTIDWQRGYGIVSFSKRDLVWVLEYIAHQKEHHCTGQLSPKLEQTESI